jgi:hypothetical protein
MGENIQPGQVLVGGQQPGQLNQYYGYADTNVTTVTQAALNNLSSVYTIPAGEAAYAGAAYELECGGYGTWGSTQQTLKFVAYLGAAVGSGSSGGIAAAAFAASAAFSWRARVDLTCEDGVSLWRVSMDAVVQQTTNFALPGTAADNSVPVVTGPTGSLTADVSDAQAVALQAEWGSTTGAPTITTTWTRFRKVA